MTIGAILIPYSFTNNTEVADAVKVNSNFGVCAAVINELVVALNAASGSQAELANRLGVALNDDGTLKSVALPVGTYDTRTRVTVNAAYTILVTDSIIKVDTTAGDVTVTFPASSATPVMPIIINIGQTGYSVFLEGDGTDTVMGLSQYALTQYGEFAQFDLTGTDWLRIR